MEGVLGQTTLLRKMTSNIYDRSFLLILFYLGLPFLKHAQCVLTIKPQNAAALSGDVVSLSCASNSEDSVAWVAYSPGSSDREYIFGGRDLSPSASSYISISRHGRGHYSLHINATHRAAKRYICVEQGSTMTASAELIILESNTECLTKVTDEFVNMSCSVRFAGNWAPTMVWRTKEGHKLGVEDGVQIHSQSDIVTSNLLTQITEYSQFKLNVITNFNESGKPKQTSATNVPEYNHTISPYSSGFEYINVTQTVETKEKSTVVVLLICTVAFLAPINIAFILKVVWDCSRKETNCCTRVCQFLRLSHSKNEKCQKVVACSEDSKDILFI